MKPNLSTDPSLDPIGNPYMGSNASMQHMPSYYPSLSFRATGSTSTTSTSTTIPINIPRWKSASQVLYIQIVTHKASLSGGLVEIAFASKYWEGETNDVIHASFGTHSEPTTHIVLRSFSK